VATVQIRQSGSKGERSIMSKQREKRAKNNQMDSLEHDVKKLINKMLVVEQKLVNLRYRIQQLEKVK
jgi:hypothetical protein